MGNLCTAPPAPAAEEQSAFPAAPETTSTGAAKPQYKLQYFNARAVAETIRLMFAVAKVDYEDARFPLSFGVPGDFSTIKRPEFDAAKASGQLTASAHKLPMLVVNGVKIGQSKSIERFLSKELDLLGTEPWHAVQIDALSEQVRDIKDAYNGAKRNKTGEEKEVALKTFFEEKLPEQVKLMEGMVPDVSGPFLFGSKASYADISMFQFLAAEGGFFDNTEAAAASFKLCPKIESAMKAVGNLAEVKNWIAMRPKTDF